MVKRNTVQAFLEQKAPPQTAEDWDNVGLLADAGPAEVTGVLVALDATPAALLQAEKVGANLLVTHHPVIFTPTRRLCADDPAVAALRAGISVLCLHTNLDKAAGGVNDTLAARLGLSGVSVAADGMTRYGTLPRPLSARQLAAHTAGVLHTAVRFVGSDTVRTVAVCGGGAGSGVLTLPAGIDAYVTGEVKHHEFLAARAAGLCVVEAGHYATEVPVVETVAGWLREAFSELPVYAFVDEPPCEALLPDAR